ncbi:hypothetical protein Pcinc_010560 [Petrolisthes cinctipes]|uniref:RNA-directed DNA polymerase n=1 Tax=Petrolisthes cinctipes TaxID=88211 RepID=A0AAE1KTH3_PETCI|nr:hypothetical protein Pcinc_010560 [Petrolisthes cinctipes]
MQLKDADLQPWEAPDGLVKYWQLVVPKKLRSKILNESHNQITSGHLGVKKTLSRLRQKFYWMGMRQDVEEWCQACNVCCAKKGPKKRGCAPLQLYQSFKIAVFCESCKLLGIKKTRTTPLRPQSDGMAEKFNWTLGQELAKYCVEGQSEWDEKLPALLMAYRSAAHESTGYTPAKLMLGHELCLPVDVLMGRPSGEELPTDTSSYTKHLQERLAEVHHQVRKSLRFSGEVMKSRYDAKANEVNFQAGDNVWFYNPQRKKGQSPKLQSPWDGTYTVLDSLSDVTYLIRRSRKSRPMVVHVNRLWQYHGP